MTSTGTYAFDPTCGNIVIQAFARCGVRRTELTGEHIRCAEFEANLTNVDLTLRTPYQFLLEDQTQVLSAETASYTLSARISSVAIAYVTSDASTADDKVLAPVSYSEYAEIPNKSDTSTGGPTTFYLSMQKTPVLYVWPLVASTDDNIYTVTLKTFRQVQDFDVAKGYTSDLPYRFLDAFTTGLSARLAEIYKPERADRLYSLYEARIALADVRDQENVSIKISPQLGGYYV